MKLLLINPTAHPWRVGQGKQPSSGTRVFRYSMLSSLYVAAAVPPDVHVEILDEEIEPVNFDTDADLIGISFMTFNAPHAYEIADTFRNEKGKKVIVGGYHPTFMPEEALLHADAVCIGEAETNVPDMIRDFRSGTLQLYYQNGLADLRGLAIPDRNLIRKNRYAAVEAVQATRGCPQRCTFCSISSFFQHNFRSRPVDEVIDEIEPLARYLLFMDDNIIADREYAKELFIKMKALGKRWFSQCSISIAHDEELLTLAAASGCIGLFIGLESVEQANLQSWGKYFCKADEYISAIERIHREKIGVVAGIVFGNDGEGADIFDKTLQFLYEANVDVLQATVLTPFPGTPLFAEMNAKGRILTKDWSKYDFSNVVFDPINMDRQILKSGHDRVLREFYSWKAIMPRIFKEFNYLRFSSMLKASIPLNISYRSRLAANGTIES
jgi:radical SAM superfamily enzyme YgiQ (UPF0313 family)